MRVNYTYGRAYGDVDNFRLDQLVRPRADRDRRLTAVTSGGQAATDTPHVFVLNGTYELPFALRLSGILFSRSGFPYTGPAGFDYDGDGDLGQHQLRRSAVGLERNSFRFPRFTTFDLSLAYDQKIYGSQSIELRFDVFNVTNRRNITNVNNIVGLDPAEPAGELWHRDAGRRPASGADRASLPVLSGQARLTISRLARGAAGRLGRLQPVVDTRAVRFG